MKLKRDVLKVIEKMAKAEIKKDFDEWPPGCIGILHQPKRLIAKNRKNNGKQEEREYEEKDETICSNIVSDGAFSRYDGFSKRV